MSKVEFRNVVCFNSNITTHAKFISLLNTKLTMEAILEKHKPSGELIDDWVEDCKKLMKEGKYTFYYMYDAAIFADECADILTVHETFDSMLVLGFCGSIYEYKDIWGVPYGQVILYWDGGKENERTDRLYKLLENIVICVLIFVIAILVQHVRHTHI